MTAKDIAAKPGIGSGLRAQARRAWRESGRQRSYGEFVQEIKDAIRSKQSKHVD